MNAIENHAANDPLYFPRTELAMRLVNSLSDGIAHAFTLFAPRRMGKTQFLLSDIQPTAEAKGFKVFYFSFMDVDNDTMAGRFQQALIRFAAELTTADKAKTLLASIDKVSLLGASISRDNHIPPPSTSDVIDTLAEAKSPILLLLDEAQELARSPDTQGLIRSLRTGLDINKHKIKVIFTGSSISGLRALFNDSKAPFFHFAHDIEFPHLGREFSDHLAQIITDRTGGSVDKDSLFQAFVQMNYTPLYLRAVAQDMILNPALDLPTAVAKRLAQLSNTGAYQDLWDGLSAIDQALLIQIAQGTAGLYGKANLQQLTQLTGKKVTTSQVQKSLARLAQKDLIAKDIRGAYVMNEQAFKSWVQQSVSA